MTGEAAALALEDHAPARGVAALHVRRIERIHVAQVCGDPCHLGVVERKRRHTGRLRAGPDEARQLRIRSRIAELPTAQVDAANRVALNAVAGDTTRRIQAGAVGNIHIRILSVMQLICRVRLQPGVAGRLC